MANYEAQNYIVTNGLVLNLDAGDPDSYTRSQPPYVEVLVVAGGGSGGIRESNSNPFCGGGGGGAGGLIYSSAYQLTSAAAVTVTVGAGAASPTSNLVNGNNGSNSVFGSLTAVGGGGGGAYTGNGVSGGSGGGAGRDAVTTGGAATAGQGFQGGNGGVNPVGSGGGGGAGQPGAIGTAIGGKGGDGLAFSISGVSTTYAGGGGGASFNNNATPNSGSGGGGNGAVEITNPTASAGQANTGGGGGGDKGGAGGSGIVIVRYPGLPAATGGTIEYLNGYTIHTFTTSGTFTPYLWNDVSGNSNNGTLNNGVGFNSYQNGGSLTFDGTDDYAPIGTTGFSFGASAGTLSAWAKTNTISGGFSWIVSYGNPSTSQSRFIGIGNSTYYFGGYSDDITSSGVPLNTWFNITGVFNGTNASMYINGILVSGPTAKSWNTVANNAQVGRQTNNSEYWNGNIAQVSIYNRALSATEITQNYNAQKNRFGL
jgi:hypothetical protein